MAQVRKLRGDKGAFDQDRRTHADGAVEREPAGIDVNVPRPDYSPAAATGLLVAQAVLVYAFAYLSAVHFDIGSGAGPFGPYQWMFISAAVLFPIAAASEGATVKRVESIAGLWGMRLIAPLLVAQFAAVALFQLLHPALTIAATESEMLRWFGLWFAATYVTGAALGTGFELLFRARERQGKLSRHAVVFGGGPHGQRFIEALERQPNSPLKVDAFFDERASAVAGDIVNVPFAGGSDELIAFVQRHAIEEIFVALPWSADDRILELLRKFRSLPATVRLAPESVLMHPALVGSAAANAALVPMLRRSPLSAWGQFFKGILDRVLAAVALLWFSPLMIAVAVAIKLTSRGPVFFRQNRLGFNNLPFSVYKFRTMRMAQSADETLTQAKRRDARITRVGAFLRKTSIDELPQLFNVLRGDMSLVGPRPHPMWRKASDLWERGSGEPLEAIIHEYAARHRVKPGITGWAQVSGYRGETATLERMRKRVELDVYYIDNWSLWFDIAIILRTFIALFRTENAY